MKKLILFLLVVILLFSISCSSNKMENQAKEYLIEQTKQMNGWEENNYKIFKIEKEWETDEYIVFRQIYGTNGSFTERYVKVIYNGKGFQIQRVYLDNHRWE